MVTYEALGLCKEGGAGELIDSGAVTYGGDWVVNPSGGLISKGHPLGATGLAQCAELTWQIRGTADTRQVEGASGGPPAQPRPRWRVRRRDVQEGRARLTPSCEAAPVGATNSARRSHDDRAAGCGPSSWRAVDSWPSSSSS